MKPAASAHDGGRPVVVVAWTKGVRHSSIRSRVGVPKVKSSAPQPVRSSRVAWQVVPDRSCSATSGQASEWQYRATTSLQTAESEAPDPEQAVSQARVPMTNTYLLMALPRYSQRGKRAHMSQTYLSLTVELPEEASEAVQDLLHEAGALGLEVRDRETPTMPGVRGPNAGESIVIGYFEDRETAEAARDEVAESFPNARLGLDEQPQQDWSNEWKSLIKSVHVGRLWVGPPWDVGNAPEGAVRLVIEPKMAFGTGDHPTTSLCLAAVDAFMADHPGASVLDVGTGTGVLAIAAKKLGAGHVVATDNDPTSVELAQENLTDNGTPDIDVSGKELTAVEGTFDLVLANILANTLIELAPLIAPKAKDRLVLAGVLSHQRADVEAAYRNLGFTVLPGATQGEWVRIDLKR